MSQKIISRRKICFWLYYSKNLWALSEISLRTIVKSKNMNKLIKTSKVLKKWFIDLIVRQNRNYY